MSIIESILNLDRSLNSTLVRDYSFSPLANWFPLSAELDLINIKEFPLIEDFLGNISAILNIPIETVETLFRAMLPLYGPILGEGLVDSGINRLMVEQDLIDSLVNMPQEKLKMVIDAVRQIVNNVLGQNLGLGKLVGDKMKVMGRDELQNVVQMVRTHFQIKLGTVFKVIDSKVRFFMDGLFELVYIVENIDLVKKAQEVLPITARLSELDILNLLALWEPVSTGQAFEKGLPPFAGSDLIDEIRLIHRPLLLKETAVVDLIPLTVDRIIHWVDTLGILVKEGMVDVTKGFWNITIANMLAIEQIVTGVIEKPAAIIKLISIFGESMVEFGASAITLDFEGMSRLPRDKLARIVDWGIGEEVKKLEKFASIWDELRLSLNDIVSLHEKYLEILGLDEAILPLKDFVCERSQHCLMNNSMGYPRGRGFEPHHRALPLVKPAVMPPHNTGVVPPHAVDPVQHMVDR